MFEFKITCKCGAEVNIKKETSIIERIDSIDNSNICLQIRNNQFIKLFCDKCGNIVFISK